MKKVLWETLRRSEFERAVKEDAIVIIPVASIEQHGNHLPVNTDTNCCFTIAQRTAQAIDEFPVLVLPPIWTGYSPHHMSHPGSITLKYHTFVELLTQVAVSVHAHGFKKILFLNGHAGNSPVIAAMRTKLAAEEGFSSLGYNYWDLPSVAEEIKKVSGIGPKTFEKLKDKIVRFSIPGHRCLSCKNVYNFCTGRVSRDKKSPLGYPVGDLS